MYASCVVPVLAQYKDQLENYFVTIVSFLTIRNILYKLIEVN